MTLNKILQRQELQIAHKYIVAFVHQISLSIYELTRCKEIKPNGDLKINKTHSSLMLPAFKAPTNHKRCLEVFSYSFLMYFAILWYSSWFKNSYILYHLCAWSLKLTDIY